MPAPPADYQSAARVERGRRLFLEQCALCHGERGDGKGQRREALDRPPRDFTDPVWRASASPGRVFLAVRDGVARSAMPAWAVLGDDRVWDLCAFVLSLAPPSTGPQP
jgi:mono/diheme cytochrome c family protein